MVGIGRTVFNGTRVEEFKAHILGVIENVIGPQRNLILAKLEGGPLAQTGVIAGMSGSPVYIDGRLIGAVSYALGSFSKEPIAGITPIDEMTDATRPSDAAARAGARVHVELPLTPDDLDRRVPEGAELEPAVRRSARGRAVGRRRHAVAGFGGARSARCCGRSRRRSSMSGFEPDLAEIARRGVPRSGIRADGRRGAAARPGEMPFEGPLKPGDAVWRDVRQRRLPAGRHRHGHAHRRRSGLRVRPSDVQPRTDRVPDDARLRLHGAAEPLLVGKLSTTGEVIGTLLAGSRDGHRRPPRPGPELIPVTLTLERRSRLASGRSISAWCKDQLFTPLMTYSALLNTLVVVRAAVRHGDVRGQGQGRPRRVTTPSRSTICSPATSPSIGAAAYIVAPLTALIGNDYETVDIERLELTIKSTEEPRTATLERVWIDDPRPRAGRRCR